MKGIIKKIIVVMIGVIMMMSFASCSEEEPANSSSEDPHFKTINVVPNNVVPMWIQRESKCSSLFSDIYMPYYGEEEKRHCRKAKM